jgi:hypothetical protein
MRDLVEQRKLRLLNPVEAIEANRNKANTLLRLKEALLPVPGHVVRLPNETPAVFTARVLKAIQDGGLSLPILASSETHKGAPTFCHTIEEVKQVLASKEAGNLQYFRSFCPGTEYRVHVLRDAVLFSQIKAPSENPQAALALDLRTSLLRRMQKDEKKFALNETTLDWTLKQLTPELLQGPGQMLRSLGRGWELKMTGPTPYGLVDLAVKALDVLGLDMGAVSIELDGKVARVTAVTTAPNLDNEQMGHYVNAIRKFCSAKAEAEKKIPNLVVDEATPEILASLTRKLHGANKKTLEAIATLLGD